MDPGLQRVLESKRAYRRKLAALPPAEKLRILDELRGRARELEGSARSASPAPSPTVYDREHGTGFPDSDRKRTARSSRLRATPHRFGGRATSGGVNYEVRVAAFVAAKMLSGSRCSVWDGIDGADITAVTMQAPEPVDDIVVSLRGDAETCVFISAKDRSRTVALTAKTPAFADTVDSFVRQFLKLSSTARSRSRLVWAIPFCAGRAAAEELPRVLDSHRMDSGDAPLAEFLLGRQTGESRALKAVLMVAKEGWEKQTGNSPTDEELRRFLRQVYVEVYDFERGQRREREAESDIRSHVVTDPKQAPRAWEKLQHVFSRVDQNGVRVTAASLRHLLVNDGIGLKSPPDYAVDIDRLMSLTIRNLTKLREHATLRFGPKPADTVHIARTEELTALMAAAKSGHLLITGEPGCGKSGLVHSLVEALPRDVPVLLLLAEEIFGRDWKGSANLPGLAHALDEVLANWPNGARGFLITDALDAVRDAETQKMLRRLLYDVLEGQSGWTVIASVREFDLKHGRELREAFPGTGVTGHSSNEFAGAAHFHLTGLSEAQVVDLAARRAEIRPFIECARMSAKSGAIHRSPFYLRLAAELLSDGENPSRLADWNSPAVLLRKFWAIRVKEGAGAHEREVALRAICRRMVDLRAMSVSLKELSLCAAELSSVDELGGRGILQAPKLRHGTAVGGDEIRFTHHLLHDYAIAWSLIPETQEPFCDFALREPLLPIFYRQSFVFALEELWDADVRREVFWECALRFENVAKLYGITRILAPILAAHRAESLTDLQPLLKSLGSADGSDSPGQKALRHLASGLQDASDDAIRVGAGCWCAFAERLASLLSVNAPVAGPLVHVLARLNAVGGAGDNLQRLALNAAGRSLLAHYVAKDVSKGWPYAAEVAIETACRTFNVAPVESERALLTLLTPERLTQFPYDDLLSLARNLKYLGADGETVVIRLFEAAFADEPDPGHWERAGSAILPISMQTSDQWKTIHYVLSEYYAARTGENAALMTEAACIAWNAAVRRQEGQMSREPRVLVTIQFRGVSCELVEDYSHIWGRDLGPEEDHILRHFEKLLREWATSGDAARLNTALDCFARCNRTSLMWAVFMEVAAEHPSTLGVQLDGVLGEPLFLTHPDYSPAAVVLLGSLHKAGDPGRRERLEKLVLDLPKNVRSREGESGGPMPSWVVHAQNRLLGAFEESNILLGAFRDLWRERQVVDALPADQKSVRSGAGVVWSVGVARRNGDLKKPANKEMLHLREALGPFLVRDHKKFDTKAVERHWPVIQRCERAVKRNAKRQPEMAEGLWGHLVGACENVAAHVAWPKTSDRWKTVRRILLKAADDPLPQADSDGATKEDSWPSWGWPSPRLDAACGLPFLACHLGRADKAVAAALRRLCHDKSSALRFNLAERLALLERPAPDLMWELMDTFIANERKFSVLDALALSGAISLTRTDPPVLR